MSFKESTRLLVRREMANPYRLPPSQHKPEDSYELLLIREEYEKRKQKLDHRRFMCERDYQRRGESAFRENRGNLINKPVLSQQPPVAPDHLPTLQTPFRGLTQTECRVPQPSPLIYSDALMQQYEDARRKQVEEREQMRRRENEKWRLVGEPEAMERRSVRAPEKVQEVKETFSRPPPRSPPVPALRNKLRSIVNAHPSLHSNTTVGQICAEEKEKMTRALSQLRGELQGRQRRLQREMGAIYYK
ncbi:hypothetical protein DNTS_001170 [Danionella cerebrum]|uniref:Uncharacterized protein n=1 Tax=Danionella cerebrum TaxID=2873325 RepID=A0A553NJC1_9TELE|nr:hypothetical protein DNTS_001170 [Danionella translucida]